ncbi:hypothetical protein JHK85_050770 [Glycine max]|nr:hypothetical protein JHK85_050770 [Glycine max]
MPYPMFFQTKRGLTLEALERKIHQRPRLQPLDQVCDVAFQYPQVVGRRMLKFTAVQLVDDEDVKGRKQMVIEQLIGSSRFCKKNRVSHGMVANDGDTWPSILLSRLIWYPRNFPINALVKSTYLRCNALFNKRGREVATMLASSQVYTQVLNNVIEDAPRKANVHIVLKFDRCDTQFLVQDTINQREVWLTRNFTIRLDER